jgi:hypothetical protein
MALEIPLIPAPQSFRVQLVGVFYAMSVRWCIPAGAWMLDIADANDEPIVCAIPLITGADLLAQYEYLGIGGQLIVQSDDDVNAVPTFENLGSIGHLYFIPATE